MRSTLYLGLVKQDGSCVLETDFLAFLKEYVTPLFPGYTVVRGDGWYQGASERMAMVIIHHAPSSSDRARIQGIGAHYCSLHNQACVLIEWTTTGGIEAYFIDAGGRTEDAY